MHWKMWIFQTTQMLVRGTSNLLVANIFWMVAFKIYVFDSYIVEETPNRSNSEIWESLLSRVFSPMLWMLSKSVLLACK